MQIIFGTFLPFFGTLLGAAFIYFLKREIRGGYKQCLLGFASGVMVAASVWSLLLPSIELEQRRGAFSFVPAAVGFFLGFLFLIGTDQLVCWMKNRGAELTEDENHWKKNSLLVLAVTIHNIPEGLSVGAAFAGVLSGQPGFTIVSACLLAFGIAVQNLPEGFIVALPFRDRGYSRSRSFVYGMLSGAVEPVASVGMILLTAWLRPLLPYLLAFSAGAMVCVVVEELLPDAVEKGKYHTGTMGFCAGFLLMMILDVALG